MVVEGTADVKDMKSVVKAIESATPGATWKARYYTDTNTGVKMKNFLLTMQDSYVFGKGYLHVTELEIPEKYYNIK
ncbi:MAG TPA: hypothetical protein DIC53_03650 [Synergistaceae bacterium]|nr:hypothetical protein [Synergistaceae bacterium]